jgi:hypothetical protein
MMPLKSRAPQIVAEGGGEAFAPAEIRKILSVRFALEGADRLRIAGEIESAQSNAARRTDPA